MEDLGSEEAGRAVPGPRCGPEPAPGCRVLARRELACDRKAGQAQQRTLGI